MKNTIIIEKEKLQQLLDNFYKMCDIIDETDYPDYNNSVEKMKSWTDSTFGGNFDLILKNW